MSSNKIDNRVIAAFVFTLALIAKPVWDGRDQSQFGPGQDDGVYMVTAKSLAAGAGYRQANLPGDPYATKYPPLFPLFLSIAWGLEPDFPRTLVTASILQDCLLPVYLALLLLVLRQLGLSWRRTFLIAAMMFVSFSFVFLAVTLYSELLFGCFLLAAIWAIERAALLDSARWALAGGLLTGLAYLTRNAALPMLAAVPIFFFLRKRLRLSPYYLAVALPIAAGWHVWGALHAAAIVKTPYLDEYLRVIRATGLGPHLLSQLATLSASIAEAFLPGIIESLHGIPLHHLVLAAAVSGWVRIGRRQQWPQFLIFTALYLVMITCWWFQGLGRLIVPVWPMLLVGIAEEASHFAGLVEQSVKRKAVPRWALIAVALYIVIRNDVVTWQKVESVYAAERGQRARDRQAYAWIAEHAGDGSIVLAWKDTIAYLYTGVPSSHDLFVAVIPQAENLVGLRRSFSLPGEFKSAVLLLLASDIGTDSTQLDSFRATAESVPGSKLEYSSPGAYVYRFPVRLSAP
jgi:hypothetical protein